MGHGFTPDGPQCLVLICMWIIEIKFDRGFEKSEQPMSTYRLAFWINGREACLRRWIWNGILRIKRNQWSDEREMLMVFLLEQVNKCLDCIWFSTIGKWMETEGKEEELESWAGQMNGSHLFTCGYYFTCVEFSNNIVGDQWLHSIHFSPISAIASW